MSNRRGDRLKRAFDLVVGGTLLVPSLPVQSVAIAIRRSVGSSVLLCQPRPGTDGVFFELVTSRSMRHPDAAHLTDAERSTRLGHFLRSTSLDELATLWNVLKGYISLVGPRPLLVEYIPPYKTERAGRHELHPGVTDSVPISGRNAISWDEESALDVQYIDTRTLVIDPGILTGTVPEVLRREGISAESSVTGHLLTHSSRTDDVAPANEYSI